jgi:hypothetical protein
LVSAQAATKRQRKSALAVSREAAVDSGADSSMQGNGAVDQPELTRELRCPRCEYDVRMLPKPRCPECGLEFAWTDILAAAELRQRTPLFEYRWRERPLRSFFGTLVRTLYPPWLWRSVPLELKPRIGPLLLLALVTLAGCAALYGSCEFVVLYSSNKPYTSMRFASA